MRRSSYLNRATRRFLEGTTRCKTPIEAVESGQRSLHLWADILEQEREVELQYLESRRKPEKYLSKAQRLTS